MYGERGNSVQEITVFFNLDAFTRTITWCGVLKAGSITELSGYFKPILFSEERILKGGKQEGRAWTLSMTGVNHSSNPSDYVIHLRKTSSRGEDVRTLFSAFVRYHRDGNHMPTICQMFSSKGPLEKKTSTWKDDFSQLRTCVPVQHKPHSFLTLKPFVFINGLFLMSYRDHCICLITNTIFSSHIAL